MIVGKISEHESRQDRQIKCTSTYSEMDLFYSTAPHIDTPR